MVTLTVNDIIILVISAILIVTGYIWRRNIAALRANAPVYHKRLNKLYRVLAYLIITAGSFLLLTRLLNIFFIQAPPDFGHITIFPERVEILGVSIGITIVYMWVVTAILVTAALLIRVTVFKNPKEVPSGAQNVIETIVEITGRYTKSQAHGTGELLSSYILSVGALLIMCAFLELLRLRAPTSDIAVTFSFALMTFFIINIYGIQRKGLRGRLKTLASPTPIVFPFRLISEIAIPVSLACRLFGNMLGGLIVVDLLYTALGNFAVGIPGVLGIYFNAFHPLIQAFIFITLTLTFINEAIE